MIFIYWTDTSKVLIKGLSSFFKTLSLSDQNRYFRFKRSEDSLNFLMGRYLLHLLLENVPHIKETVSDIVLDQFNRPTFLSDYTFSISHSDNYVAVALLTLGHGRLGLDIEMIKPIRVEDYMIVFSDEEKLLISNSAGNQLNSFFDLWTRKESFLKALGEGFYKNPSNFSVLEDKFQYQEICFYLNQIEIHTDLAISLCSNFIPNVRIVEITNQ